MSWKSIKKLDLTKYNTVSCDTNTENIFLNLQNGNQETHLINVKSKIEKMTKLT